MNTSENNDKIQTTSLCLYQDPFGVWLRVPLVEISKSDIGHRLLGKNYANSRYCYLEHPADSKHYLNYLRDQEINVILKTNRSKDKSSITKHPRFNPVTTQKISPDKQSEALIDFLDRHNIQTDNKPSKLRMNWVSDVFGTKSKTFMAVRTQQGEVFCHDGQIYIKLDREIMSITQTRPGRFLNAAIINELCDKNLGDYNQFHTKKLMSQIIDTGRLLSREEALTIVAGYWAKKLLGGSQDFHLPKLVELIEEKKKMLTVRKIADFIRENRRKEGLRTVINHTACRPPAEPEYEEEYMLMAA